MLDVQRIQRAYVATSPAQSDSLKVDLSQDYLFFYDQLEKANLFLQGVIDCANKPMDDNRVQFFFKNPLNDGGTFCGVADLTEKYGVVPMSAMPETFSAENTSKMASLITTKLREYGLKLRKMVAEKKSKQAIQAEKSTDARHCIPHAEALHSVSL